MPGAPVYPGGYPAPVAPAVIIEEGGHHHHHHGHHQPQVMVAPMPMAAPGYPPAGYPGAPYPGAYPVAPAAVIIEEGTVHHQPLIVLYCDV